MGQVNFKTSIELQAEQKQADKRRLTAAVQRHLDETARERGYDNILSLCTYATDPDPTFAAEGQAGVEWRGACWKAAQDVLNDVTAGTRGVPTEAELIAELPGFTWPGA